MANSTMDGGSGSAKKKMKPGVAARNTAREKFVSEKKASKGITTDQARQRFYVQTRMAEMKAKGKTVTPEMRKKLQQKFQSGDVARKCFAAPKKKISNSGSSSVNATSNMKGISGYGSVVTKKVAPKVAPRNATSNMKGISGYGRTDSSGRTGMGATMPKKSAAGRGKGADPVGISKSKQMKNARAGY